MDSVKSTTTSTTHNNNIIYKENHTSCSLNLYLFQTSSPHKKTALALQ